MERERLLKIMKEIIKRKAVNPAQGGEGEWKRANYIQDLLEREYNLEVRRYEVEDEYGYLRPSLFTEINGNSNQNLWIVSHIDTVSEGEKNLWKFPPFDLTIEGNKVYGRGVSDNGIGIFSSLLLIDSLFEKGITSKYNLKFAFLADEEAGSKYGLKWILENTNEFKKGDLALVPDFGNSEGSLIEIAEKGILWIKIETFGEQTHASKPGKNAHLLGMKFSNFLYDLLHKKYPDKNNLFDPPSSTFEPTKKEKNVDGINIIPGKDVIYWDMRILPKYEIHKVLQYIKEMAEFYSQEWNTKINVEPVMMESASQINKDLPLIFELKNAIKKVLEIEPKLIGIGGGTFAGILRKKGINAVVWGISSESEHQPNEWEYIDTYYKMARVFEEII